MRTAALIFGTFGGFMGVYFAQLLVTGTALFGVVAAAFGGKNAQEPLLYGVAVLATYTLGAIGGILAIPRARTAAALMALSALTGIALTVGASLSVVAVVSPTPAPAPTVPSLLRTAPPLVRPTSMPTPTATQGQVPATTYVALSLPIAGPALLLLGAVLALFGSRSARMVDEHPPAAGVRRWTDGAAQ